MILPLLPYQRVGAAFLAERDRAALFDVMGLGKSAQAIAAMDKVGARRIVIVCPAAVREVWKGEFAKFSETPRRIIKGRNIQDLNTWLRGKADVLLLSYEMAVKWAPRMTGDIIDTVVFDECFPYFTMVDTELGPRFIGEIVEGRLPVKVWCWGLNGLELKPVTRYIRTYTESLVTVHHQMGAFECTPNHKIWTLRGYVEAARLDENDVLRVVQPRVPAFALPTVLRKGVLCAVAGNGVSSPRTHGGDTEITSRNAAAGCGREDATPEFRPGISRQTGRHIEVAERSELDRAAGRQRLQDEAANHALRSAGLAGELDGVRHINGPGEREIREFAARLQGGYSASEVEAGYRSGWAESPVQKMAIPRFQEGAGAAFSRVVRVEVQEPRSAERSAVYNIEVADNHNYFANGVLVGNCHYLKSPSAQRTISLLGSKCDGASGLARWGAYVWFLTGTPNPNDAADCWSIMRFCRATPLSRDTFCNRYFKSKLSSFSESHSPRKEKLAELKQALSSFSLRRTKAEAGVQLPPIWLTTTTVDGDTEEIRALLREHPGMEKAVIDAVERGGLSFLDAQHIATLRRLVGEAKAPAFVELLREELKNGLEKVVVFGIHTRALDHIENALRDHNIQSVRLDGRTNEGDRGRAVRDFQETAVPVFLGNIRAAGTGLTLTAATDVIMFESDWSPAGNAQAIMRCHRIGQTRSVHARFITLAGSIDEHVSAVVARKTAAIAQIHEQEYA